MSEADKLDSIEDVLSSIRRLVADGQPTAPERPKETPVFLKEVDIIEIKPTETLKPQAEEPAEKIVAETVEETVAEPTAKLPSFVERMNASIAKITQEKLVEKKADAVVEEEDVQVEEETDILAEIADAQVEEEAESVVEVADTQVEEKVEAVADVADAQVEEETDIPAEVADTQVEESSEINAEETVDVDESADIPTEKPETLFLQPAMATNTAEATTNDVPDQGDVETVDADDAETEVQAIPDEDTAEITLPDDAESNEAVAADETETDEHSSIQHISEEALRLIVSELVRSELQGDLGDRITRNVRKLVRREIQLALANRDVE